MKKRTVLGTRQWMIVGAMGVGIAGVLLVAVGNRDRASGVLSLLDQIAELEPAGPWSLVAFVKERKPASQKQMSDAPHAHGETAYSLIRRAELDLPSGTTVLARVTYSRPWGQGGKAELLACQGNMIVERRETPLGLNWQEFRLPIPEGGADALELQVQVPRDTQVPSIGLTALAMDRDAAARDWRRAAGILAWAARQPPDVALQGLRWRRFHLVQGSESVPVIPVVAGDTLTFDIPHPYRGGRLEFEALGLRVGSPSEATLRLEVRSHGQWYSKAMWQLQKLRRDDRAHVGVDLPPTGDRIRFTVEGTDEVMGLSRLLILPPHPSHRGTNLVLIDLDTMRADRLETYGYTTRPTSNRLDSLLEAKGFVVFRSAFSGGPYTISATPKFFASRFMNINAGESIPRENLLLAEVLGTHGYYCAAFTGGAILRCAGFAQGFHEYHFTEDIGKADEVFPSARRWLEANTMRPFFLFIHTYESHTPYTRDVFCKQLSHGRLGDVSAGEKLFAGDIPVWDLANGIPRLTPEESLYVQAAYDGGVRTATEATSRFLSLFDRLGLWENTVVVILSDHGEEFWEHTGVFAYHPEHSVYNEVLRVPFMLRQPDATRRGIRFVDQMVSTVDLVPTLLRLLGLSVSEQFDGADLMPLMEGRMTRREIPVLATNDLGGEPPRTCVYANGMKYVAPDGSHPLGELYDLANDPHESINLAARNPVRRKELAELLDGAVRATARPASAHSDSVPYFPDDLKAQLRMLGYLDRD